MIIKCCCVCFALLIITSQSGFSFAGAPSYAKDVCGSHRLFSAWTTNSFFKAIKELSIAMTKNKKDQINEKSDHLGLQSTEKQSSNPVGKPEKESTAKSEAKPISKPENLPKGCTVLKTGQDTAHRYKEFYPLTEIANITDVDITLKFEVKSKSGVYVFLSAEKLDPSSPKGAKGWLVELNGDGIISSYIHLVKNGNPDYSLETRALAFKKTRMFLNDHFSGFWISLASSNREISFGRKCKSEPILAYSHPSEVPVKYVSFSSKDDSDSEWIFGCSKDIVTP